MHPPPRRGTHTERSVTYEDGRVRRKTGVGPAAPCQRADRRAGSAQVPLAARPAGRYLVLIDILMTIGAMGLLHRADAAGLIDSSPPLKVQAVYVGTVVITFCAVGLYRSRLTLSVLDDLPAMAACFGTAYLGCFFLSKRVWSDVTRTGRHGRASLCSSSGCWSRGSCATGSSEAVDGVVSCITAC